MTRSIVPRMTVVSAASAAEVNRAGWTNLPAAGGELFCIAQTGGSIYERIGQRFELRSHQQAYRNHYEKNPPPKFFDILLIKDTCHYENERQMQKVGTKAVSRDLNKRLCRQIGKKG